MNVEQLYRDYGIPYVTNSHKHAREGWVNCPCPFCQGNTGFHLGYDTVGEKFVCWRCGGHGTSITLQQLLKKDWRAVKEIISTYGKVWMKSDKPKKRQVVKKILKLPATEDKLTIQAKKYLESRGLNPRSIAKLWGLKSTALHAQIDGINYRHRLLIPYYWEGRIVSFDTRDVTGKASVRFMACKEERETIRHKDILYGLQEYWGDIGYCVEGCGDVWSLGPKAFAVSGIKYTPAQVRLICKYFKKVAVIFDNESQAKKQANKLIADLKFRGVQAIRIDLPKGKDPGDLSREEVDNLFIEINRKFENL